LARGRLVTDRLDLVLSQPGVVAVLELVGGVRARIPERGQEPASGLADTMERIRPGIEVRHAAEVIKYIDVSPRPDAHRNPRNPRGRQPHRLVRKRSGLTDWEIEIHDVERPRDEHEGPGLR
jgi:hypothetical protein